MPKIIDKIVVVDDGSKDATTSIVRRATKVDKRVILIQHKKNQGVGGAVASGYIWSRDHAIDIAVVIDGDGQMLPKDLKSILDPVIENRADYSKANRLLKANSSHPIPRIRFLGNAALTFLTKITSGYWQIMDSQAGYRAINKKMLHLIDWTKLYKRYGYPNDILVRLNVYNARVIDVPIEPVYHVGEKSSMKILKVIFTISIMLVRMFLWRLKEKYILRDFHPLVLFYFFGFILGVLSFGLLIRWLYLWPIRGEIPPTSFLAWMFTVITSLQFTMFAMWFDMDYNKHLTVRSNEE